MRSLSSLWPLALAPLGMILLLAPYDRAVATPGGPWQNIVTSRFAVTPDGTVGFLPGPNRHTLLRVDLSSGKITGSVVLPSLINGVELSPDGSSLALTAPLAAGLIPVDVDSLAAGPSLPTGKGPRLPVFTPNGSSIAVLCPPEKEAHTFDWLEKALENVVPLGDRPFAHAYSPTPDCLAVTFPKSQLLQVLCGHDRVPMNAIVVGPRPRWIATSPAVGTEPGNVPPPHGHEGFSGMEPEPPEEFQRLYVITDRKADQVYFVDAVNLDVLSTLDLKDPDALDSSGSYAFIACGDGKSVAVVSINSTDPAFGTVVNTIHIKKGKIETLRVAIGTGVCYALTYSHKRLYALDPASLPLDGSTVDAGAAIKIK